jgi:hypothetical protein
VGHRVIIIESITPALQNEEVREHFTNAQCAKVDQILAAGESACTDEQFRYLQRRLAKAFCQDD